MHTAHAPEDSNAAKIAEDSMTDHSKEPIDRQAGEYEREARDNKLARTATTRINNLFVVWQRGDKSDWSKLQDDIADTIRVTFAQRDQEHVRRANELKRLPENCFEVKQAEDLMAAKSALSELLQAAIRLGQWAELQAIPAMHRSNWEQMAADGEQIMATLRDVSALICKDCGTR